MKRHPGVRRFGHRRIAVKKIANARIRLLQWWRKAQRSFPWRLTSASDYHRIVSELLLQRTTAAAVQRFWPIFIQAFPSWEALAGTSILEIRKILKPIGLSNQRAPRLQALAKTFAASRQMPSSQVELETLPGVGQYVANAIQLFIHDIPRPLLDSGMARIFERVFGKRKLADLRDDPFLQELSLYFVEGPQAKYLNWALLDLAGVICKIQRPLCPACPLNQVCNFGRRSLRSASNPPAVDAGPRA
jgi:A/G-specific adenine glycosylase